MKKKVLLVISNLGIGGGAEKSTTLLARGLKNYYDVELLTFYDFEQEYGHDVRRHSFGFKYSKNIFIKGLRFLLIFPFFLRRFLKKNRYDVVVSGGGDSNLVTSLTRGVFYKNFTLWLVIRADIRNGIYKRLSFLYKHAEKIIVLTKALQKRIKYKSTVIENAIEVSEISRKNESIPEDEKKLFDKKTILMIGRLAEQKNHLWFFDVFKRLNRKDVNLLIIGSGPKEKELKEKAKDMSNVYFLGRKENVYKYLNNTSVFVLPSLFEGMPRALMEALAVGCVSVANDCQTGPRELLEVSLEKNLKSYEKTKYGYLVPFNNKKEFIKALNDALDNGKRIKPDKRFSLEKVTKEWREEIERG